MSRVVFVSASEAHVLTTCRKHDLAVSDSEPLPSGGTRVVLKNVADAEKIAGVYGKQVLKADTPRMQTRLRS